MHLFLLNIVALAVNLILTLNFHHFYHICGFSQKPLHPCSSSASSLLIEPVACFEFDFALFITFTDKVNQSENNFLILISPDKSKPATKEKL